MKNLPLLFCGIFFALAFSFCGLILSSNIQLGSLTPSTETLVPSDTELDKNGLPVMVMAEGEPMFPHHINVTDYRCSCANKYVVPNFWDALPLPCMHFPD